MILALKELNIEDQMRKYTEKECLHHGTDKEKCSLRQVFCSASYLHNTPSLHKNTSTTFNNDARTLVYEEMAMHTIRSSKYMCAFTAVGQV